jgi:uncharacterized protein YwqG
MKLMPSAIKRLKRKSWKPLVIDGDGALYDSKFGGTPWLGGDEFWPTCQHCGKPMPLFLQLNLKTLPQDLRAEFGKGLLQLFYCTSNDPHCESECDAFFPFTKSKLVRIIEAARGLNRHDRPDIAARCLPKCIIAWEERDDYPYWEEGEEYSLKLSHKEWKVVAEHGFPRSGDKLAGWPDWIQGIEYPYCPLCNERMRLIFQLDSNDHVPYMFGDLGCGYITQCPVHTNQVAFAWACS